MNFQNAIINKRENIPIIKYIEFVPTKKLTESGVKKDGSNQSVHMKKELGLLEGVAIIVGIIIGSGMVKHGADSSKVITTN